MAFCTGCGAQVADGTAFCPTCGKPMAAAAQQSAPPPATGGPAAQSPTAGMSENVAGLLCYVLGWLTGLIFLLIDKRPFVRFHAAQSIVVFGAITVLYWIMATFLITMFSGGWALFSLLFLIVRLGSLVLWILLMVKAYQGQRFRVPFAADFADSLAGKVKTV